MYVISHQLLIMDVDVLKIKVIKDFNTFVNKLNKGYKIDHEPVMKQIFFIENYDNLNNIESIGQRLINIKYG